MTGRTPRDQASATRPGDPGPDPEPITTVPEPRQARGMDPLITEHLDEIVHTHSPRTVADRRRLLARVDRDLPHGLVEATPQELAGWLSRADWSPAAKTTYRTHIRSFFSWCVSGGLDGQPRLDWDPSARLPRPRVPRTLPRPAPRAWIDRALACLPDPWRLCVLLGAYAGLRCCEIAQLHREDITEQTIRVRRGKGGRPGSLPTHPLVWAAVADLPPGPLVTRDDGAVGDGAWLSQRMLRVIRRHGLHGVTMHQLRHAFGTAALDQSGGNIRVAQELLRHETPVSTAIYTKVTQEQMAGVVRAMWAA